MTVSSFESLTLRLPAYEIEKAISVEHMPARDIAVVNVYFLNIIFPGQFNHFFHLGAWTESKKGLVGKKCLKGVDQICLQSAYIIHTKRKKGLSHNDLTCLLYTSDAADE